MYNAINKRRFILEDIEKVIKRDRDIAIINDELARKEKLSNELDEQIKQQNNSLAKLKFEVQTLEVVKMIALKVVESIREKKRLELLSQHLPRFSPQLNRYFIPVPWRPF
jgi:hypothetical protein